MAVSSGCDGAYRLLPRLLQLPRAGSVPVPWLVLGPTVCAGVWLFLFSRVVIVLFVFIET